MIETPEYADMLARMIRRYGERVGQGDEVDLARMVEVRDAFEDAIQAAVDGMRERGCSWQYIATGLGTNRSSAHERFGRRLSQSA